MLRIMNALWASMLGEDGVFELYDHFWSVKVNKKRTKVVVYSERGRIAVLHTAGRTLVELAKSIDSLCEYLKF